MKDESGACFISKSLNHLTHAPEFNLKEQIWKYIQKGLCWKL